MKVMEIAEEQGITGLKFAAVTGDSIDDSIEQYYDEEILEFKGKVADWWHPLLVHDFHLPG